MRKFNLLKTFMYCVCLKWNNSLSSSFVNHYRIFVKSRILATCLQSDVNSLKMLLSDYTAKQRKTKDCKIFPEGGGALHN